MPCKQKHYLKLDVSQFVHLNPLWKLEFIDTQTVEEFLRDIARGITDQGYKRDLHSAGYGLDWIIRDEKLDIFLENICMNISEREGLTLSEAGIKPDDSLKVVDLAHRLEHNTYKVCYKKHFMKDGKYRIAEYAMDGSFRFVSEDKETVMNFIKSNNHIDVITYMPPKELS